VDTPQLSYFNERFDDSHEAGQLRDIVAPLLVAAAADTFNTDVKTSLAGR